MKVKIMQLQNFSVHDGEGIRTVIFMAGCPLRCLWCANPEGRDTADKIAYYKKTCLGCGCCQNVCPQGLGIDLNLPDARAKCLSCGRCAEVCPNGSRKKMLTELNTAEIIEKIKPQLGYFAQSGGGVTFSGGEATLQTAAFAELARELYDMGVDLALETSGYFDFESIKDTLELMETIFVDIKLWDEQRHIRYTGVSNKPILANIPKLAELTCRLIVRIPVIETVNADPVTIAAIADFVRDNAPHAAMELLPYHNYGDIKYEALGESCPDRAFASPSKEQLHLFEQIIQDKGIELVSYL